MSWTTDRVPTCRRRLWVLRLWEAFLLQMDDFELLLELKLRRLLDAVVAKPPPNRRRGRTLKTSEREHVSRVRRETHRIVIVDLKPPLFFARTAPAAIPIPIRFS
jgi:hypothetical protein